jgi:hypothetical protein
MPRPPRLGHRRRQSVRLIRRVRQLSPQAAGCRGIVIRTLRRLATR